MSTESKQLLQELHIESNTFEVCNGNEVQQKVHHELVTIVDIASDLYYKAGSPPEVKELSAYTIEFADASNAYNKQGHIQQALTVADCAWAFLNCAKAVGKGCIDVGLGAGEGVIQGVGSAVHSVTHPAQTAKDMVKAIGVAGYYLGKLTYEELISKRDLVFGLYNEEYFEKYCRDVQQKNDAIIAFIDQAVARIRESSLRDISREVTSFAVEGYLTGKALDTAGKFFRCAKVKGIEYAEKIKQAIPRPVAITPEGIPVSTSIAEHASKAFHNFMEGAREKLREVFELLPESTRVLVAELKVATEAVREEIPALREMFDGSRKGFGEFANKYVKMPYEHILSIEYFAEGKKFAWSGFHHDFMGKIEQSGSAKFTEKVIAKNGCYKAKVTINGITKEICTFFPQEWTRKQVIAKVYEAYDNFIASGAKDFELAANGVYEVTGFTREGIEIEMYITKNGRITSAYPVL